MAQQYSIYSPYYKAKQTSWYMDYYEQPSLPKADSDVLYTIDPMYNEQPWRLAKDLYGNERLYYIFALLNPDLIQDPVYDFKAGIEIRVPTSERVQRYLK